MAVVGCVKGVKFLEVMGRFVTPRMVKEALGGFGEDTGLGVTLQEAVDEEL